MKVFLSKYEINTICLEIAKVISKEIKSTPEVREILFICTLRGAFPFFSQVIYFLDEETRKRIQVEFIQPSSYKGNERQESVQLPEPSFDYRDKKIFIFEDILDSYNTIKKVLESFKGKNSFHEITIVALLAKHSSEKLYYTTQVGKKSPYIVQGKMLQNNCPFLYGFGLDNNEKGRLLEDIFIL